jgi:hypothetical protein
MIVYNYLFEFERIQASDCERSFMRFIWLDKWLVSSAFIWSGGSLMQDKISILFLKCPYYWEDPTWHQNYGQIGLFTDNCVIDIEWTWGKLFVDTGSTKGKRCRGRDRKSIPRPGQLKVAKAQIWNFPSRLKGFEAEICRGRDRNILLRSRWPKDPEAETIRIFRDENNMPRARWAKRLPNNKDSYIDVAKDLLSCQLPSRGKTKKEIRDHWQISWFSFLRNLIFNYIYFVVKQYYN